MCGIFLLLNSDMLSLSEIKNEFMKGKSRGPENSKLETKYLKMLLGFHRLAINGLNEESNQPLIINDIVLICNGEIYNYKPLFEDMNINPTTGSDCEVIIHLYIKYGIEQTLSMLDGVFSFVLFDNRITENLNNKVYIARDPYGVRPLYYFKNTYLNTHGFASEIKCLEKIYNITIEDSFINQFIPGTYSIFNITNKVNAIWEPEQEFICYFKPSFSHSLLIDTAFESKYISDMYKLIPCYLKSAVNKRCITTERPIACLLSGGLDSSLIAALVNNYYKTYDNKKTIETYSIGLEGSEDLKYAKIVADYLGTQHTEIIVTEKEMVDAIPEVIYAIESYDTTTVRASIGNYLLGKYITTHSKAKVIFNGDGSDELFGGYLYMNKCPDDIEFDKETRRLLKDIYLFDVLRSDKTISSNGLEPRTPFLDKSFVNYVLSIPPYFRNHKNKPATCEKYILRNSFHKCNFQDWRGNEILPNEILWRKKEAFSDGVSSHGKSLYKILQTRIALKLNLGLKESSTKYEANLETEKYYYKSIFENVFPNCNHLLPYYWMPKYTDAKDPSARTLSFYKEE
jgi:asparagine synthase (glutamine-hydrolysing)